MATRTKTIQYANPVLATAANNTLTALTQITIYIPESGKTFRSVMALVSANQNISTVGNVNARRLDCRLGAAGFASHNNTAAYSLSGEDVHVFHALDLTSHFTANWTGTSMTFDSSFLYNGAGTAPVWKNVSVTLYITYDYDDTSATQVKTVRIPLDAPVSAMATSKPGTAVAVIPNLSTELPEASKTFRNHYITVQGNRESGVGNDSTITMQLDSTTAYTTDNWEGLNNSDYYYQTIWHAPTLNTSAAMDFFIWSSVTDWDHPQIWLTVTYEFDATSSNQVFVSVLMPITIDGPMGGTTSTDKQSTYTDFFIEEPGTITTKQVAFFVFYTGVAAIGGLNMRLGSGSFVAYSSAAAGLSGSQAAMCRDDSAFTLARGRNTLNFDIYRTDTTDFGFAVSGFWIVNYTADKPTQGYGAANHTIFRNTGLFFDGASVLFRNTSALSLGFADSTYYINNAGIDFKYVTNSTNNHVGYSISVERLGAEGGIDWPWAGADIAWSDPETGLYQHYINFGKLFKRYINAPLQDLVPTAARRYKYNVGNGSKGFFYSDLICTYHSIEFTVAGTISGFSGTVNIDIYSEVTGEKVLSTSRSGDGAYSLSWHDNTENLFAVADDGTTVGRSQPALAA